MGKFTALDESVVPVVVPSVTPGESVAASNVQSAPPGSAFEMSPSAPTTCLTTDSDPWHSPSASWRSALPTIV